MAREENPEREMTAAPLPPGRPAPPVRPMTRPWAEVAAWYEGYDGDSSSVRAMAVLTRAIAASGLASGLYAWTSMFDLCVVQTEVAYPYDGPYLRVSPRVDGKIEFRYIDTPEQDKQWHRVVDPQDALLRLLGFLDQLHWFPKEVLHTWV